MFKRSMTLGLIALAVLLLAAGCEETEEGTSSFSIPSGLEPSETQTFTVPSGASSIALVIEGGGGATIQANSIKAPDGTVVYDFQTTPTTNGTFVRGDTGVYTLIMPSTPDINFTSGDWEFTFVTDSSTSIDGTITSIIKETGASGGALDANFFFVGADIVDASTAATDETFQRVITRYKELMGAAGITLGNINYIDITDGADALAVIDSFDGPNSELGQLFTRSSEQSNRAINYFFVKEISGGQVVGRAGGVPGPPGRHGTTSSGVAIAMSDLVAGQAMGGDLDTAVNFTALIMAHETGHYLGLFHPTERAGKEADNDASVDPISDTPECEISADANGNGSLSSSECDGQGGDNLMFWAPPSSTPGNLTAGQINILQRNYLVQ